MRRHAALVPLALLLVGCAGEPSATFPPIAREPSGLILAGAPPIECRGVDIERCRSFGAGVGDPALLGLGDVGVTRVVVTCESPTCSEAGGAVRVDILVVDGRQAQVGRGVWGSAEQPLPPSGDTRP